MAACLNPRIDKLFFRGLTAIVGVGVVFVEASRSYSDTLHTVGHLVTSDRPVAKTSIRKHTTLTRDRYPCPSQDSNPQSQQACGLRHTP